MIKRIFGRLRALRQTELIGDNSNFYSSSRCLFDVHKTAKILVKDGSLHLGFSLPKSKLKNPTANPTTFLMGEGSTLECHGDVFIGPGAIIRIQPNAKVIFGGGNIVAHNTQIICSKSVEIKQGAAISWNCTLIDDDGHQFCRPDGTPLRRIRRPLIIGENSGIQMNVLIPSGVSIGDNSVVAAGTVLRQDVPPDSLVYSENKLKIKAGFRTNFGLDND